MVVAKVISRTLLLFASGVSIIVLSCIYEIYVGTDLSHPMWDRNYNWLPLLQDIATMSLGGSVASVIPTRRSILQLTRRQPSQLMEGADMAIKKSSYRRKLVVLETQRQDIARKLDRSYTKGNISDLLALEAKYENLMRRIEKIQSLVGNTYTLSTGR